MEVVNSIIGFLTKLIQWWFIVNPWEQAIRVRKGKNVKILEAGLYFKIPFIDQVYTQTTRKRMIETAMQTVTSKDGTAITMKLCIGYAITDVLKLYKTLFHPETTISNMAIGMASQYIRNFNITGISPKSLEYEIEQGIDVSEYGLGEFSVQITTFAIVKTFRLIQDSSSTYRGDDLTMTPLK